MELLKKIIIKSTGNFLFQKLLEKNINISQYLSGIGSGSLADKSGEKIVFKLLKKYYAPPFIIFDVGANKGQYLELIIQNLVDEIYSLHCFEPHKETFQLLKSNNKKENIYLNNFALSESTGKQKLFYNSDNTTLACLTKRRLDHFNIDLNKTETVDVETLDNYSIKNNIDRIQLLKIDVEGHEFDVLKGASNMFENNKIGIVTFEFGGTGIDTKIFLQDYYYFFNNYGKVLYRITPSGYLYKIKKYDEIHEQFRATNFIALDKELITN